MILSPNYCDSQKDEAKKITEALVGIITEKYICNKGLILGDDEGRSLPDLHTKDESIGYEIVQSELECDHLLKTIYKVMNQENSDYKRVIEKLSEKRFPIKDFEFHFNGEGKIISPCHKELGVRLVNYMNSIYADNIRKKLKKLNTGNYDGCKQKNLIICSIFRFRDLDDAKQVNIMYNQESSNFKKSFDNVFFITVEGVYLIYPKLELIASIKKDYSNCIYSMRAILGINKE